MFHRSACFRRLGGSCWLCPGDCDGTAVGVVVCCLEAHGRGDDAKEEETKRQPPPSRRRTSQATASSEPLKACVEGLRRRLASKRPRLASKRQRRRRLVSVLVRFPWLVRRRRLASKACVEASKACVSAGALPLACTTSKACVEGLRRRLASKACVEVSKCRSVEGLCQWCASLGLYDVEGLGRRLGSKACVQGLLRCEERLFLLRLLWC
jgi:hypothetical protein